MQNIPSIMQKYIQQSLLGLFFLLSIMGVSTSAIDTVKGVQPSSLAVTLYSSRSVGAGYQGTFFIKSTELIDISNKMLQRAGVQYTLTKDNTRSTLASYVTTEAVTEDTKTTPTVILVAVDTPSFSEVNQKLKQASEANNDASRQSNGILFSDVSSLLHQ